MQEYSEDVSVKFTGVGVHFGKNINMEIVPMQSGGVTFVRTDANNVEIPALYTNVVSTNSNTTIGNGSVKIATIEHFMAALYACNVKHAKIFIDSSEIPLMDGGSNDFIFGLECINCSKQKLPKLILRKEIVVELKDSYIRAMPSHTLRVHAIIDFPNTTIGRQEAFFDENAHYFKDYISHSKTFSHIDFVRKMQEMGIAQGGDIYSAIIFDNEKILSPNLSYNGDDFAKHKILDFIGDIMLCDNDIKGDFECYKSSHQLNNMLLYKIFEDKQNYEIINY
jgi:UDP-3-O-[3-hydroxymyristoyl] N-acetylglucosamine deacetylase